MEHMAVDYIHTQTSQELTAISNHFQRDTKYVSYFHGFFGGLNGTYVPVMVTAYQIFFFNL